MALTTFFFNGTEEPDWLLVKETGRPMFTPVSPATIDVAGRRGVYFFRNKTESKELTINITVLGNSHADLFQKIEYLNQWLDTGEVGQLSLSDEPQRYYEGVFVPTGDTVNPAGSFAEGTLTFLLPDPYKRGLSYTRDLGNAATPVEINNNGTAGMYPKFTVEFQADSDFFGIAGPEGFVQVGSPSRVDQATVKPLERVLLEQCNDLGPWHTSGLVLDYGEAAGSLVVEDNHMFKVFDYGNDADYPNVFHGPVMKRSIPEQVQDFRLTSIMRLWSSPEQMGRIEVYFLNAAGAVVCRFIMWDRYPEAELNTGHITAGPNYSQERFLEEPGPRKYAWNDFTGKFYLRRTGDRWQMRIVKMDGDRREIASTEVYRDIRHAGFNEPIAQIQIGMKKYGDAPAATMRLEDIIVERVNDVADDDTESASLFQAGDVLQLDHATGTAWLNGEYFNMHLEPGSSFFPLQPGVSQVQALTSSGSSVEVAVSYTEMYK